MDLFRQFAKGEPVFLAGVIAALSTGVGLNVAPDVVAQLIAAIVPIVLAFAARANATPAANPETPGPTVIQAGEPKVVAKTAPVITFSGRRS